MKENANSTRRSFLKSGLVLAAPLAAVGPPRVVADDGLKAHLARLEDEAAIGKLHQSWLRQINSGSSDALASMFTAAHGFAFGHAVRNIAADHAGEPDAIAVEPTARAPPDVSTALSKARTPSRRTARWLVWRTRKAAVSFAGPAAGC